MVLTRLRWLAKLRLVPTTTKWLIFRGSLRGNSEMGFRDPNELVEGSGCGISLMSLLFSIHCLMNSQPKFQTAKETKSNLPVGVSSLVVFKYLKAFKSHPLEGPSISFIPF